MSATYSMRLSVLGVFLVARLAAAQSPGATVSGIVRDSLARRPLAGATVQLVGADPLVPFARAAVSDSLGAYAVGNVPDGRYTLGFLHPMLDSLGLEPTLRGVRVEGGQSVRADLAIPSATRLRVAICGTVSVPDAVVVGIVRDAGTGAPIAGASVTGEWNEISFTPDGLVRRIPRLSATTGDNGWFFLCNVPRAGTIALVAAYGADSTDQVEVKIPDEGYARRELHIGAARAGVSSDANTALAARGRPQRIGDGRLSGTVVSTADWQPLANAEVGIVNGPRTRANQLGEWSLTGIPTGTRVLEVRAVGYYPERRAVDVVADAPIVRVALATMKSVLDTVKVTATLRNGLERSGFAERRRSGVGHYLTAGDVAKRAPIVTTDLLRNMSGVKYNTADEGILVRGAVSDWCTPEFYLDGRPLRGVLYDEIDSWVHPDEIAGIEFYTGISTPIQYQTGLTGCGSIVIWTHNRAKSRGPATRRGMLLGLGAAVVILVLFGLQKN